MVDYKYKDLFWKGHIDKQLKIATDDGLFTATNTDINWENFELTESLCSDSELRFGSCEASMVKFQIRNAFIPLSGKRITVTETLEGNMDEPFQYGIYKVFSDMPTADREYRDIIAYDAMYDIINADMAAWYNTILPDDTSTVSLKQFRESFLEYFDLDAVLPAGGLVNDNMTVERTIQPEQISGKDVITAICEINGCLGHIGRDGKFHYIYLPQAIEGLYPANNLFPDHAPEWMVQAKTGHLYPQGPKSTRIGIDKYIKCQYKDYVTKRIVKLQIRQEENDIGIIYSEENPLDSENCYIIENNFLVYGKSTEQLTEIAENVFWKITDIVYRPFDCTAIGNPCIEVGDPVRLPTKYKIIESYVLQRTMKGIQALRDTYTANGTYWYAEKVNGVQKSIVQLKGKTNVLKRTIEETRIEMSDMDADLRNTITVTARELDVEIQNAKENLETSINATAGSLRTEIKNTKDGLETSISQTDKEIRADVSKIYETKSNANTEYTSLRGSISLEAGRISSEVERATKSEQNLSGQITSTSEALSSKIEQTESRIQTQVSAAYETKTGAQTQYNSLSSSISQTVDKITSEVNRATAAEGNLSSQIQQMAGQIVLKADSNGKMVQVALGANPQTGSEFKVDADSIDLTANDVINMLSGGTINLSAMDINITSNNWSVDAQGNMACNKLSAVQFVGQAIDDLNDAIFNSETMRRMQEIVDLYNQKFISIEELLTNDKVIFDLLDATNYYWTFPGNNSDDIVQANGKLMDPWNNLASYVDIDTTGYIWLVARCKGTIDAAIGGQTANYLYIGLTFSNDPTNNNPDTPVRNIMYKNNDTSGTGIDQVGLGPSGEGTWTGGWYNAYLNISALTGVHRLNCFIYGTYAEGGATMYCSKISLTNIDPS